MAPIIERIVSGCASNLMRVLISLTAPVDGLAFITSLEGGYLNGGSDECGQLC